MQAGDHLPVGLALPPELKSTGRSPSGVFSAAESLDGAGAATGPVLFISAAGAIAGESPPLVACGGGMSVA